MFVNSHAKRFGLAFVSLLALAGCAEFIESDPVPFERTAAGKSIDIVKINTVLMRSMLVNDDGSRQSEIKGVPCKLASKEFETKFVTPALVNFPVTKGQPSPMRLTCATKDYATDITLLPGKSGTVVAGASAVGVAALLISSAAVAASDNWTHANQPIWIPMIPRE